MRAVFWKEVKSYFYSPIAYVLIGMFTLISSIMFWPNLLSGYGEFNGNLGSMGYILIFLVPILTMRIIAEDRKNGTEVLLLTSPINLGGVVLGKYFAALSVFLMMILVSFIYPIILVIFGASITPQIVGGYAGLILLGASFISVGIFASSLTENQVIASIISFVALLIIWIADGIGGMVGGFTAKILYWFSLLSRYEDFNRGILSLSAVVYYLSFISVFLFVTIMIIERRRWSQR
ncbi:MAG TPA: ABC-2 transporter permease [Clostridiales bacterium]|nr:ABC-2 transporter permease [Clostridiales bacterium]